MAGLQWIDTSFLWMKEGIQLPCGEMLLALDSGGDTHTQVPGAGDAQVQNDKTPPGCSSLNPAKSACELQNLSVWQHSPLRRAGGRRGLLFPVSLRECPGRSED